MSAFTRLFRRLSPAGPGARLSILIFHRVLQAPDALFPGVPDRARFNDILQWVKSWFNVLPLDEAVQRLAGGALPERAAAITFDDGYGDNFTQALPVLHAQGLTATFFIATGFLDGGRMFNDTVIEAIRRCSREILDLDELDLGQHRLVAPRDRRAAIDHLIGRIKYLPVAQRLAMSERIAAIARVEPPADIMLSSDQVRALHQAGMQIGAHTVSHPILTRLTPDAARREIADSRSRLEELLGQRVGMFAYPNGKPGDDYAEEHAALVRDLGFDAALSTQPGAGAMGSDLMQLPRFTPWGRSRLRFGIRLATNLARS